MFNSLLQKTKKAIETKVFDSELFRTKPDETTTKKEKLSIPSDSDNIELKEFIYDVIKTIKDPEKPATLEDLNVIHEEDIFVLNSDTTSSRLVRVEFTPTVPHCSLATLIGLCIRVKLQRNLTERFKLDIYVKKGSHSTEDEINKQVNDKERVAAAMENPNLQRIVNKCIDENE